MIVTYIIDLHRMDFDRYQTIDLHHMDFVQYQTADRKDFDPDQHINYNSLNYYNLTHSYLVTIMVMASIIQMDLTLAIRNHVCL